MFEFGNTLCSAHTSTKNKTNTNSSKKHRTTMFARKQFFLCALVATVLAALLTAPTAVEAQSCNHNPCYTDKDCTNAGCLQVCLHQRRHGRGGREDR